MNFTKILKNSSVGIFATLLLSMITVLSTTVPTVVSAETVPMSVTECFEPGLYKFQSVKVSVGPEESSYNAGDTVNFVGDLINENTYPVVDGNVFVRISKNNDNFIVEGHNTVDEIVAVQNIMIDSGASVPVSFSWKVPAELGAGNYRADYFFSVGKKFNLGGLPFTNEVIIGFANFEVKNDTDTSFVLDRSTTMVNGEKYEHIGNWPLIPKDQKIEFSQSIKNLSSEPVVVDVNYDLYYWDSLNQEDKITSKVESVTVPASSLVDLKYVIEKSTEPVYYLKIKATSGGESSIVNIRTTSDITRARINYPAITNFPIKEGETTKLFSCFHTAFGDAPDSKIVLTLSDKKGEEIVSGEYSSNISSDMSAAALEFTAEDDYKFINLKATLVDQDGKVVDSYETNYDCSVMNSEKCQSIPDGPDLLIYGLAFLFVALITLLASKKTNNELVKKTLMALTILLLILAIASFVGKVLGVPMKTDAETVTNGGRTKSDTRSISYEYGYNNSVTDQRTVAFGYTNYTFNANLNGGTASGNGFKIPVGGTINFTWSGSCFFNAVTGAWDTPYCGTETVVSGNKNPGWISVNSSDPTAYASAASLLNCSGSSCTAATTGNTTAYYNFSGVTFTFDGCANTNAEGWICDLQLRNPTYPNLGFTGGQNLSVGGYSPAWSIQVYQDAACGTSSGSNPITSEPTTNPAACSIGTYSNNPADTSTHWNWTCVGINGGANSPTCSAPKNIVVPPPTNVSMSCSSDGNTGTISWNAPSGYNTFNWRANPNPPGGPRLPYSNGGTVTATSATFPTSPGQTYIGWVHTYSGGIESVAVLSNSITCPNPGAQNAVCGTADQRPETDGPGILNEPTTNPEACNPGVYENLDDTSNFFRWKCKGIGGGADTPPLQACYALKLKEEGACGSANGHTVESSPTGSAACSTGTYNSAPNDTTTQYLWTCYDTNGGTSGDDGSVGCSATKPAVITNPEPPVIDVSIDNDDDLDDEPPATSVIVGTTNDPNQQCEIRVEVDDSLSGYCEIRDISGDTIWQTTYSGSTLLTTSVNSRNEYTVTCTDSISGLSETSTVLRCILNPSIIEE